MQGGGRRKAYSADSPRRRRATGSRRSCSRRSAPTGQGAGASLGGETCRRGMSCALQRALEVGNGFLQPVVERDLWLPIQQRLGFGKIGLALPRIVLRQRLEYQF